MADEVVLQEFPMAGRYRVRMLRNLKTEKLAVIDVREYIVSGGSGFEGFTRKGVRLDLEAMKSLRATLDTAISALEVKPRT